MQITIIGAGQAGLLLGNGLLDHGYDVTIINDRTPEALRNGSILSTQCMFDSSLEIERSLGLHFWDDICPPVEGVHVAVAAPDATKALSFNGMLERPGRVIDQRLKISAWMEHFSTRGGKLVFAQAGLAMIEQHAARSDLVIVAAGKGEIGALFRRDAARSPYAEPQRVLAASCAFGYEPAQPFNGVCFSLIPGVGEFFVMPGLTSHGSCHFMVVEGIPGGPLDCWQDVRDTHSHMARLQEVFATWLPWEHERARHLQPTDGNATLRGRFAPTVRHPVATLPSGAPVLALADTAVLNDPITGQGANNAAKAAAVYLEAILAHGDKRFDSEWMQATFERYWEYAGPVTAWTNAMLQPPPPHVLALLGAAAELPAIAHGFANGFDRPHELVPLFFNPLAAEAAIAEAREHALALA